MKLFGSTFNPLSDRLLTEPYAQAVRNVQQGHSSHSTINTSVNIHARNIALLALVLCFAAACGQSGQEPEELQASEDSPGTDPAQAEREAGRDSGELREIAEEVVELVQAISGDVPAAEVVGHEEMEQALPRRAANLNRISRQGRTNQIGLGLSSVEAVYGDDEVSVTIGIADLGPYSKLAHLLLLEWTEADIDKQTHEGYERTRQFSFDEESWPAYEKLHVADDFTRCSVQVWVAHRFLVHIEGEGADMGLCDETRADISFERLARLAAQE